MFKKLLITIFLGVAVYANPLAVDSLVPQLQIKDQFEKEHTLDANVKTILFASDKETSDILRDYLLSKGDDVLIRNSAVYVADISGMPSIITKFIALPKMKKYPFSILLLDDTNKDNFAKEEGKIIIYSVDNLKVTNITKVSTAKELENIIK